MRTRTLPIAAYVVALLLLPASVVAEFMSTGWWATIGTTAIAQGVGSQVDGGASGAAPAAPVAAADVKGSMTVQHVVDAFPVTAAQVFTRFGVAPSLPISTQLKTLVEGDNGVDIPALRTWLAEPAAG
jgi:hypothetical protein